MLDFLDSAVLEHGQVAADLQHLAVARSVLQDLRLEPCAAGQPLAGELGWFDQALGAFQPQLQVGPRFATSGTLAVSVQRGQVGKFLSIGFP